MFANLSFWWEIEDVLMTEMMSSQIISMIFEKALMGSIVLQGDFKLHTGVHQGTYVRCSAQSPPELVVLQDKFSFIDVDTNRETCL